MRCPACNAILQWNDGAFCAACLAPKPAPSAEPVLNPDWSKVTVKVTWEGSWIALTLGDLAKQLSRYGLAIVPASEVGKPPEPTLLERIEGELQSWAVDGYARHISNALKMLRSSRGAR